MDQFDETGIWAETTLDEERGAIGDRLIKMAEVTLDGEARQSMETQLWTRARAPVPARFSSETSTFRIFFFSSKSVSFFLLVLV